MASRPDDPTMVPGVPGTGTPPPAGGATFQPGQKLGTRYTIIRLLGKGGMGAVYQAWDEELNVAIAIKFVLPDAVADAGTQRDLQQRFKRELLLARQVTHKNVVRIYDLGEIDGLKYITMSFVEGETLGHRLSHSDRLPVPEAVRLGRQIVDGLQAAHEVGIVHRDLKPDNVMITPDGHALIMDFGIARSAGGLTQTAAGAVVGTLKYMAPEQASGTPVDHRADIYALGLMLYDMLVGRHRLRGREHPRSELMARLQKAPAPLHTVSGDIPEALSHIVTRCTQPAPDARYATTTDLAAALGDLAPDGHRRVDAPVTAPLATPRRWWAASTTGLVMMAVLGGGVCMWRGRTMPPPPVRVTPMSVLIADFENATSEDVFNGVVEQALGLGLESAAFISNYSRRDALSAAAVISPGTTALSTATAQLVALRAGIDLVLAGRVVRENTGYRITVNAYTRPDQPAPSFSSQVTARDKASVLDAVGRLAIDLRARLGDSAAAPSVEPGVNDVFTAASLEAARSYARGQEALGAGRFDQADAWYQDPLKLDPQMGRAWTGRGAIAANQGRREDALQFYQEAMARLDRMTEREKFRTRGAYYLVGGNAAQALQENEALVKAFPSDGIGFNNLALSYFQLRDFGRAAENGARARTLLPARLLPASNAALFALYAGDFAAAEQKARAVLEISPGYPRSLAVACRNWPAISRARRSRRTNCC